MWNKIRIWGRKRVAAFCSTHFKKAQSTLINSRSYRRRRLVILHFNVNRRILAGWWGSRWSGHAATRLFVFIHFDQSVQQRSAQHGKDSQYSHYRPFILPDIKRQNRLYRGLGSATDIMRKWAGSLDLQDRDDTNRKSKESCYAHGCPKDDREELCRKGDINGCMLKDENEREKE